MKKNIYLITRIAGFFIVLFFMKKIPDLFPNKTGAVFFLVLFLGNLILILQKMEKWAANDEQQVKVNVAMIGRYLLFSIPLFFLIYLPKIYLHFFQPSVTHSILDWIPLLVVLTFLLPKSRKFYGRLDHWAKYGIWERGPFS